MRSVTIRISDDEIEIESNQPPREAAGIFTLADRRVPITLQPDYTKVSSLGDLVSVDAADFDAVMDHNTGLMWSARDVTEKKVKHEAAAKACAELTLAGHSDWRLPTIRELQTLVDHTRHEPAIDTRFFPTCKNAWYWTSTPTAWSSDFAWVVSFGGGGADDDHRDDGDALARAVRSVPAGQ